MCNGVVGKASTHNYTQPSPSFLDNSPFKAEQDSQLLGGQPRDLRVPASFPDQDLCVGSVSMEGLLGRKVTRHEHLRTRLRVHGFSKCPGMVKAASRGLACAEKGHCGHGGWGGWYRKA